MLRFVSSPSPSDNLADWAIRMLEPWLVKLDSATPLSDSEIHSIRIASKHLRAAWTMAEPCVGKRTSKKGKKEMKRLAKHFAGNRDATVQIKLMKSLVSKNGDKAMPKLEDWTKHKVRKHFKNSHHPDGKFSPDRLIKRATKRWQSCTSLLFDTSQLEAGTVHSHEMLHKKLRKAMRSNKAKHWHRCRKWVKYVYYQHSIIADLLGEEASQYTDLLKTLGSVLGKRHDLYNFQKIISSSKFKKRHRKDLKKLQLWASNEDISLSNMIVKIVREIEEI